MVLLRHPASAGGDRQLRRRRHDRSEAPTTNLANRTLSAKLPISPQVGEMPSLGKEGRTEGGAKDRYRALLFWAAAFFGLVTAWILERDEIYGSRGIPKSAMI
ncbi:hypothetical protein MesoLjLa_24310 [Mesorhizobium sp. L-2-11]|nr:hypothetical protein MesoLjLa_24310 [Mesorhizobium sp. L-2-11]